MVAEIATQARPQHPEKTSTRQFDSARATSAHPNAPSARWIAKRLGHPWPKVVEISLDPKRDIVMTDSAARRPAAEKWLNLRHLHFALRFVARERDETCFTEIEYGHSRDQLLAADSHRAISFLETMLPTRGQIIQIAPRLEAQAAEEAKQAQKEAKDAEKAAADDAVADEAAVAAGEKPKKKRKSQAKPKTVTAPPLPMIEGDVEDLDEAEALGWWNKALVLAGLQQHEVDYSKGVPVPAAIDFYIEATGLLPPSTEELQRFATAADFSLSNSRVKETADGALQKHSYHVTILRHVAEVAELRAKRGLSMPDEMATKASANPTFDLTKLPPDCRSRCVREATGSRTRTNCSTCSATTSTRSAPASGASQPKPTTESSSSSEVARGLRRQPSAGSRRRAPRSRASRAGSPLPRRNGRSGGRRPRSSRPHSPTCREA